MRGRWPLLVISVVGSAAFIAAACAFPDVTFGLDPGDGSAEGGDIDIDAETGGPDGAGMDAEAGKKPPVNPDVDPEGGAQDATTVGEAGVPIDASGCTTCDCDLDGYNRIDKDAGCDGGGNGKPADCDDLIKAIHPGVQGFVNDPWPVKSQHNVVGDWDCNGQTLKQYPYDGTCAVLSACADGFVGNPACGASSDYLTCAQPLPVLGATCSETAREATGGRRQGCR